MQAFLRKHLDDLLILTGSGLLIFATWLWSLIAALYVAGAILIILGILIGLGGRAAANAAPIERGKQ